MEIARNWTVAICFAAVACTVLEMLHPNGVMKKSLRLAESLFFLCVLVFPLTQIDFDIDSIKHNYSSQVEANVEALSQILTAQSENAVKSAIAEAVKKELSKEGIETLEITVETFRSEEGIELKSINIAVDQSQVEKVRQIIDRMSINAMISGAKR